MEGEALREALSRLIDTYESHMPHPVHMQEIPEKMLEDNIRGIVGFRILIDEIQAARKMSQNRDDQSYRQVIDQLDQGDETARAVAAEMKKGKI
jgi:transcriptional regulator